jgi:hypothetical protein
VWRVLRAPLQIYGLSQGLLFACIFPFVSQGGVRALLRRINPWYTLVAAGSAFAIAAYTRVTGRLLDPVALREAISWLPLGYFPLMFAAFALAARQSAGRERLRVYWAAGSICVGFLGPLIQTVFYVYFRRTDDVLAFLPLTLIAIPLGLAYTILRQRTVDVGFAISRALVLTLLSFAVIAVFGVIERALDKIFIDASHIAVEIALAFGLGFSLRTLHARIERVGTALDALQTLEMRCELEALMLT